MEKENKTKKRIENIAKNHETEMMPEYFAEFDSQHGGVPDDELEDIAGGNFAFVDLKPRVSEIDGCSHWTCAHCGKSANEHLSKCGKWCCQDLSDVVLECFYCVYSDFGGKDDCHYPSN